MEIALKKRFTIPPPLGGGIPSYVARIELTCVQAQEVKAERGGHFSFALTQVPVTSLEPILGILLG